MVRKTFVVLIFFALNTGVPHVGAVRDSFAADDPMRSRQDVYYDGVQSASLALAKVRWCSMNAALVRKAEEILSAAKSNALQVGLSTKEIAKADVAGVMMSKDFTCNRKDSDKIGEKMHVIAKAFKDVINGIDYRSSYRFRSIREGSLVTVKGGAVLCNFVDGLANYVSALGEGNKAFAESVVSRGECTLSKYPVKASVIGSALSYVSVRVHINGKSIDLVTFPSDIE
ncbi:hypothetical protein ACW7BJ_27795 [Azospirillum argentinense]